MSKYKTKVPTWLPIFSGFYENFYWEPDLDSEAQYLEDEHGYKDKNLWEKFDYRKWNQHISKELCNLVEEFMSEWILKIEYEKISSPREYNFSTDAIHCNITVKPKAIREYLQANKEAFAKYIKDRYTSRDGFMSWFSNDIEDWALKMNDFKDFNHKHECGSILEFIARNEGIEEGDLYERMIDRSQLYAGEFFVEGFWKEVYGDNSVTQFVKENYTKPNLLNLLFENFDSEKFDLETIMHKTMKEIESHTLELQFK